MSRDALIISVVLLMGSLVCEEALAQRAYQGQQVRQNQQRHPAVRRPVKLAAAKSYRRGMQRPMRKYRRPAQPASQLLPYGGIINEFDRSVFTLGLDYRNFFSRRASFDAGVQYWGIDNSSTLASFSMQVFNFDAGASYNVPISRKMSLYIGGRAGIARTSVTYSTAAFGSSGETTGSDSTGSGTILFGFQRNQDGFLWGGEFKSTSMGKYFGYDSIIFKAGLTL